MNTAWLVFELDRNSLWQMSLWHLSWARNHSVAPCFPVKHGKESKAWKLDNTDRDLHHLLAIQQHTVRWAVCMCASSTLPDTSGVEKLIVACIDDNAEWRLGFGDQLKSLSNRILPKLFDSVEEFMEDLKNGNAPHIVFLDIFPGENVTSNPLLQNAAAIQHVLPGSPIVVVSDFPDSFRSWPRIVTQIPKFELADNDSLLKEILMMALQHAIVSDSIKSEIQRVCAIPIEVVPVRALQLGKIYYPFKMKAELRYRDGSCKLVVEGLDFDFLPAGHGATPPQQKAALIERFDFHASTFLFADPEELSVKDRERQRAFLALIDLNQLESSEEEYIPHAKGQVIEQSLSVAKVQWIGGIYDSTTSLVPHKLSYRYLRRIPSGSFINCAITRSRDNPEQVVINYVEIGRNPSVSCDILESRLKDMRAGELVPLQQVITSVERPPE